MARMLAAIFVSCWLLLVMTLLTSAAMVTAERVRYFFSSVSSESRFMPMRKTWETVSGSRPTSTIAPSRVQSRRMRRRGRAAGGALGGASGEEAEDIRGIIRRQLEECRTQTRRFLFFALSPNAHEPRPLRSPSLLQDALHVLPVRHLHRPLAGGRLRGRAGGRDRVPGERRAGGRRAG